MGVSRTDQGVGRGCSSLSPATSSSCFLSSETIYCWNPFKPGSLTPLDTRGFPRRVWAVSFLPLTAHPMESQPRSQVLLHADSGHCSVSILKGTAIALLRPASHPLLLPPCTGVLCFLTLPSLHIGLIPFTLCPHPGFSKGEASCPSSLPLSRSVLLFAASPNLPSPPHWNFLCLGLACLC